MAKPSETPADASVSRGRWSLEWESESGNEYILHDADTDLEFRLSYEDMRDLRYCFGGIAELCKRDLVLRQGHQLKEE